MIQKTNPTTLAGEDDMPNAYITPSTMPVTTHFHAVLTIHAMPGSAVLNPGFLTKRVGISALRFTSQGISEQRLHM